MKFTAVCEQIGLWSEVRRHAEINLEAIPMLDGEIIFCEGLFSLADSQRLYVELDQNIQWRQDYIKVFGQTVALPRLTAWYGEAGKSYRYSGIEMNPAPWIAPLLEVKSRIEDLAGVEFNSVLLNKYRTGKDGVAWHSDDELELGHNPVIGSVSFGGTRRFVLRHKYQKDLSKISIDLTQGSFLLMKGTTQHFWQHQVPKTSRAVQPRINLTFRVIV